MRLIALVLAMALATAIPAQAPVGKPGYTLWLVRHAEKSADDGDDPGLTETGELRAANLANGLQSRGIRAIWSTDTRRTQATARPLAEALGLEVRIYAPADTAALAQWLTADGVTALVVGHSNTIPELVTALGRLDVEPIADDEYDRLYRVIFVDGQASLAVSSQKELFGDVQNHNR